MIQTRYCELYVADFETTVDENTQEQTRTDVWAGGFANLRSDEFTPYISNSLDSWYEELLNITGDKKSVVYFHNMKFDNSFLLDMLLHKGYKVAYDEDCETWYTDSYMPDYSIKTTISSSNEWYEMVIHIEDKKYIYIRDSAKLLPFALADIGEEMGVEKKEIDYIKHREVGEELCDEDREYLERDIEILWRALKKFVLEENHTGMTIGSCCKSEYIKTNNYASMSVYFPNIAYEGYDPYFRKAYHGGICYLNPKKAGRILTGGITYDVNSLYPAVMNSDRKYPIGKPHPFKGSIPYHVLQIKEKTYFIRFSCSFRIKPNRIPIIQIRDNPLYDGNEYLESTDVELNGEYYNCYEDENGGTKPFTVELTMNEVDFKLFRDTYDIDNFEVLDGAWFWTKTGKELFGEYIKKYEKKKINSEGISRISSKLLLNNLAGKLSAKPEATTRVPYLDEDGNVKFNNVVREDPSRAWYIPAATYITAYGREVLLDVIKQNYKYFVYCDTDSVHLQCGKLAVQGIKEHPTKFGYWKLERFWELGLFVKQKTYIEKEVNENDFDSTYVVKCSGMCRRSKALLTARLEGREIHPKSEEEKEWLSKPFNLTDFKSGFEMPGGLAAKRISGGVVLVSTKYRLT